MSKMPPIPVEQRSFTGEKGRDRLRSAEPDRRDEAMGQEGKAVRREDQSAEIRRETHHPQHR
ncbi:MAG TPA: hypothetical protein VHX64_04750 [Caulobacteraceae bacterium]|jgi:hypothetical protein|nr:hypothetical protein [Caulobacteraceae bacterium]